MLYLTFAALLEVVASATSNINLRQDNHLKLDFSVSRENSLLSAVKRDEYDLSRNGRVPDLSLLNNNNSYLATLKFGSQGEEISLQIDTGSADTWVMSTRVKCKIPLDNPLQYTDCSALGNYNEYASSSSSSNITFADGFKIEYGDSLSASGHWVTDYIAFGDFNVSNCTFGVVTETDRPFGILGLGLTGLETTNNPHTYDDESSVFQYENFPVRLKATGLINKVLYSLYLNDTDASTGSLLFGAVDHAKYSGQLQTVPLINLNSSFPKPVHFSIVLSSVSLESESRNISVSNTPIGALLDSGSTLSYIPRVIVDSLVSSLGGALPGDDVSLLLGTHKVDCKYKTNSVNVIFGFSGAQIRVPLSDLIITIRSECYLSVISTPKPMSFAILGDNFLRNAYVVYDLEDYEISLAQARYSSSEDIEVVSNSVPSAVKAASYSETSFATSFTVNSGSVTAVLSSSEFKTKSGSITSNSSSSASSSSSGSKKSGASKVVYFAGSFLFGIIGACGILIL